MKLALVLSLAALAVVVGVGIHVTDFPAYLGSDPATCNRCHVMDSHYEGWYHAAHRPWATCVDCHAPHDPIPKFLYKGYVGARDAAFFTLNIIPEPLRADSLTQELVQANCLRCHEEAMSAVGDGQPDAGRTCVTCHRSIAHGERGVSLLPFEDTGH